MAFIGQRSGEPLKWRQFDEISKDIKSKQDGKVRLKSCFRGEIKCVILKENNDNPYEINNNYIELSIVFHHMIIFSRK